MMHIVSSLFLPRVCLLNKLRSRHAKQDFGKSSEHFWERCIRRLRLILGHCLYHFSKIKLCSETGSVGLRHPTPFGYFVQPVTNTGPGFQTPKRPVKIPLLTFLRHFIKNSKAVFQTLERLVLFKMLVKNRLQAVKI